MSCAFFSAGLLIGSMSMASAKEEWLLGVVVVMGVSAEESIWNHELLASAAYFGECVAALPNFHHLKGMRYPPR